MIQFNLLPDVKKEYIKAKRTRRLISSVSFISAAASIGVTLILFSIVQFGQKTHISDLSKDIQTETAAINSVPDINKILTVQNQLNSVESIHIQKPASSRIFDYLVQVTPVNVKINNTQVDLISNTLRISGSTSDLASVNQYADTLKFVTFTATDSEGTSSEGIPFNDVVTQLNRDTIGATYTIDLIFNPIIFDNTLSVVMVVPSTITTRSSLNLSEIDSRNDLFEDEPTVEGAP